MSVMTIRLSDDEYEACKKAAELAHLSVTAWARHHLMKVAAPATAVKPITATQTKAQEKAAQEAAWCVKWKANFTELLTTGVAERPNEKIEPYQIRSYFGDNPPAIRAKYEAVLREVMAELGINEHAPAPPAVAPTGWDVD